MSNKQFGGPLAACVECDKMGICPIATSRPPANLQVDDNHKCIMQQMAKPELVGIANQLIGQIGFFELEVVRLKKKLAIVDEVLAKKGTIYRASPV